MNLTASCSGDGFGPVHWWVSGGDDDELIVADD